MSFGQVKSMSRRYFSEKLKKQVMSSSSESVKSYLQVNPYLKPQGDLTSNPVVQLWINRLRLQTEEYCHIHKTRKVCFFCKEYFTSAHYLVECPVTASPSFQEILTEDEHSFQPLVQAQKILSKLHIPRALEIFSKYIVKRPPKISCSNPQHGILRYFGYHL